MREAIIDGLGLTITAAADGLGVLRMVGRMRAGRVSRGSSGMTGRPLSRGSRAGHRGEVGSVSWKTVAIAFAAAGWAVASEAGAEVIRVDQEGTQGFASIAEAILAASSGDRIEVYPGYYDEREADGDLRLVNRPHIDLEIVGVQGGVLIEGLYFLATGTGGPSNVRLEGLCFTGVGPVFTLSLGSAHIERCEFRDVELSFGPAIVEVRALSLRMVDCVFQRCRATATEATVVQAPGDARIERCVFVDCIAGGSIIRGAAQLNLDQIVASSNEAGVAVAWAAEVVASSCTFWGNDVPATLFVGDTGFNYYLGIDVSQCIHVGNAGDTFANALVYLRVVCSDLVNGSLIAGYGVDTTGVFSRDPLFCDPENGDFRLDVNSPCLPGALLPECDLIGAIDGICGASPVQLQSWGRVKARFR